MNDKHFFKKIVLRLRNFNTSNNSMGKYPKCIDYMQKGLKERGVNWVISEEVL